MKPKTQRPVNLACKTLCAGILAVSPLLASAVDLADAPLFSTVVVPGNLVLALSVEWPTATTPAYLSTTTYSSNNTYLGYFDPGKCYKYSYNAGTPSSSYFYPASLTATRTCAGSATNVLWSGNYLNWSAMQTLDSFRWVLTGGYRSTDTVTNTILTKTYAWMDSENPNKTVSVAGSISGATPLSWASLVTRVQARGTAMYFTRTGAIDGAAATNYDNHNNYAGSTNVADPATVYRLYINVKVCDPVIGVESNCVAYGANYKPEGLLQKYSQKLRYSAFGYYNDSSSGPQRDGSVMRARMKYIAPTQPVPGSTPIVNPNAEWSSTTGVMQTNPDPADSAATVAFAGTSGWAVAVPNSGVMNYLNKFGYSAQSYKSYDPVGELYYSALRYLKNLGNVSSYSSLAGAGSAATASSWLDGFPAITNWDDPVLFSCQSNFILGIGDVYAHRDANLPGTSLNSGNEPALPTAVTADTTVNVTDATNMVGLLEGYANLGTTWVSDATGRGNTFYIAGLAYDAHTNDIRSDLSGKQTVNTYWMDVLEGQKYRHKNQYWLAAKYGGFKVDDAFAPYAATNGTGTIAQNDWYTTADTLSIGQASLDFSTDDSATTDRRPDNYFPGNSPETMKTGLTTAFDKIVSEASVATSTGISTPTPRQTADGNANFSVTYDPTNWTSILSGQLISFDADGTPTLSTEWNAGSLLDTRTAGNRLIVTCCTNTGIGLPFTYASLTGSTLLSRTNIASFNPITGVTSASQSIEKYVNYLRGERTNELSGATGFYRKRTHLLGDVVNARLAAVGAPSFPFFDIYNPGYSAFKATYANRPTVVYAGANDGMLHAFDGKLPATAGGACTSTLVTPNTACGKELFAYIPSFVYGDTTTGSTQGLASLGNPSSFTHHFMVDATPVTSDVDFFKTPSPTALTYDWRTILVGGLGKGGKGYYAIDITNPASWTSEANVANKVLWEFTDSHMGYSYGDAVIVRTPEFGWTVIVGSGYNNDDGKGYIYFINPRTGALLKTLVTPEGDNGTPINLAQITAYTETYREQLADSLYAGDLQGNIWRVDLTPSSHATTVAGVTTSTTSYDYTLVKIGTLKDSSGVAQPITTKPLVEIEPSSGKRFVMVGTGQLLSDNDISSTQRQAFYAINDGLKASGKFYSTLLTSTVGEITTTYSGVATPNWGDPLTPISFPVTRSHLVDNTDLTVGISSSAEKPMGWFYDLATDSGSGIAERVNIQPTATSDGIVGFAANLPNGNACSPAGTSRIFAVSFATGLSAIQNAAGVIQPFTNFNSNVTDVSFFNVQGKTRLYVGAGGISKVGEPFPGKTTYRRLNWREVPSSD